MIELCEKGIEQNYSSKYRKGNVIHLPEAGRVIISGDLHGHWRNFEKMVTFADLDNNPDTHIIFQEILHGGPEDNLGGCISFKLFAEILEYQLKYPDQVFLIMGNHDTAIIGNSDVMKGGKEMNQALKAAMKRQFDEDYQQVILKLKAYLLSQPIGLRTDNRIWVSHSLPANKFVDDFDMAVFEKQLGIEDVIRLEPLYQLTWGRRHSRETLDKMAHKLDVDFFVLGHQPQDQGWSRAGDNLIILGSDHNHGCILNVDLAKNYSIDELENSVVMLASIA